MSNLPKIAQRTTLAKQQVIGVVHFKSELYALLPAKAKLYNENSEGSISKCSQNPEF